MIGRISINRKELSLEIFRRPQILRGYLKIMELVEAIDQFYSFDINPPQEFERHPTLGELFHPPTRTKRFGEVLRSCFEHAGSRLTLNFRVERSRVISDFEIWDRQGNGKFHLQVLADEGVLERIDSRY